MLLGWCWARLHARNKTVYYTMLSKRFRDWHTEVDNRHMGTLNNISILPYSETSHQVTGFHSLSVESRLRNIEGENEALCRTALPLLDNENGNQKKKCIRLNNKFIKGVFFESTKLVFSLVMHIHLHLKIAERIFTQKLSIIHLCIKSAWHLSVLLCEQGPA